MEQPIPIGIPVDGVPVVQPVAPRLLKADGDIAYEDAYCKITVIKGVSTLVIKNYFFPTSSSKKIALKDIEYVKDHKFELLMDKAWGMGLSGIWFARDMSRFVTDIPCIVVKKKDDSVVKGFSCERPGEFLAAIAREMNALMS